MNIKHTATKYAYVFRLGSDPTATALVALEPWYEATNAIYRHSHRSDGEDGDLVLYGSRPLTTDELSTIRDTLQRTMDTLAADAARLIALIDAGTVDLALTALIDAGRLDGALVRALARLSAHKEH